jgi:hypothetical protein
MEKIYGYQLLIKEGSSSSYINQVPHKIFCKTRDNAIQALVLQNRGLNYPIIEDEKSWKELPSGSIFWRIKEYQLV